MRGWITLTAASGRSVRSEGDVPPEQVVLDLEEALNLLATLEEVCMTLMETDHLTGVVAVEAQIRLLSHRLGFDDPEEDLDVG